MKILYFAWLKHRVGKGSEEIDLPDGVATVSDLAKWLGERTPAFAEAYAAPGVIRVAVNHSYVPDDAPIGPTDEVAFFPPVTGG